MLLEMGRMQTNALPSLARLRRINLRARQRIYKKYYTGGLNI